MGKKSKYKKRKNSNKKSKEKEFRTRRELVLSMFPRENLEIWFGGNEQKLNEFGDYLIEQEDLRYRDSMVSLLDGDTIYDEKIKKLQFKKIKSMEDLIATISEINGLKRKIKKGKKLSKLYKTKDLGIATYLDGSRYSKKYLDKNKYRKELKNIVKSEKRERKEMIKLGYLANKDVDEELNKLRKANKMMETALFDAYIQKHYIS